ncbi:MAG: nitroreductase family protein [Methanoregula sp.]|nr:nitroreductase family protein [Methanoregula sp.]
MESSDFLEFLKSRSSVRIYNGDSLTGDEIEYILNCAGTAPSAGNLESWDVIVVRDPEIRAALAHAAFDQDHVELAGTIFVVCANYVRSMSRYGERGILYGLEDATIACTYMMLAAHAKNLHSCWTGAFDDDEVRGILDLPQHIRPVALLVVGRGYPSTVITTRMDAGEHVHQDIW